MKRVVATTVADRDAAEVIKVIDDAEPTGRPGWTVVEVKAATLNRHDLWSIHGIGIKPEHFPLPLGSDLAGVTEDGREVLVHALIADPSVPGGELLDPKRAMLAEATLGACAEKTLVPTRNLVDKPADLTFEEAACLPTAWLTAFSMLFTKGAAYEGQTVLIQGAGGGVSTAATALAHAAGLRVGVTGRSEDRLAAAKAAGADAVFGVGTRLPERVDLVIETVGAATWEHSVKSVKPGGVVMVAGATTGGAVQLDLNRIFLQHIGIVGSAMGTIGELRELVQFCVARGVRPAIDSVHAIDDAAAAVARLESGHATGKVVVTP